MTAGVGALVAMAIGLDLGKPGPTAGDAFFFASQLWSADRTHRVGSNHGYCVVETPPFAHCSGTVRLGAGALEYAFQLDMSTQQPPTPAILGGTGAFANCVREPYLEVSHRGSLARWGPLQLP